MKTYTNPVFQTSDPFVLLHNGKYYLYTSNSEENTIESGYKVFVSENLITWEDKGFCLKKGDVKGEIIVRDGYTLGFWAPEVMYKNGKFYMAYTAEHHLGIAVSDSPLGPFTQEDKRFLFDYEAIDGSFFIDDDGSVYLYYRHVPKNRIVGVKMNDDLLSVDESTTSILITPAEHPWELDIENEIGTEGPFVIKHNGYYYITYSANDFRNKNYAIGCAVSKNPLGPYKKYEGNPILKKSDCVFGTGHHCFTTSKDGKKLVCVYHCHNSATAVEPRMTCIDIAEFVPNKSGGADILVINGPTNEPQPLINE